MNCPYIDSNNYDCSLDGSRDEMREDKRWLFLPASLWSAGMFACRPMAFFNLLWRTFFRFSLQFIRALTFGLFFCAAHYFFPPFAEVVCRNICKNFSRLFKFLSMKGIQSPSSSSPSVVEMVISSGWSCSGSIPGGRYKSFFFQLPQMPVDHSRVGRAVKEPKSDDFFQKLVPIRGLFAERQEKAGLDKPFRLSPRAIADCLRRILYSCT